MQEVSGAEHEQEEAQVEIDAEARGIGKEAEEKEAAERSALLGLHPKHDKAVHDEQRTAVDE